MRRGRAPDSLGQPVIGVDGERALVGLHSARKIAREGQQSAEIRLHIGVAGIKPGGFAKARKRVGIAAQLEIDGPESGLRAGVFRLGGQERLIFVGGFGEFTFGSERMREVVASVHIRGFGNKGSTKFSDGPGDVVLR